MGSLDKEGASCSVPAAELDQSFDISPCRDSLEYCIERVLPSTPWHPRVLFTLMLKERLSLHV